MTTNEYLEAVRIERLDRLCARLEEQSKDPEYIKRLEQEAAWEREMEFRYS